MKATAELPPTLSLELILAPQDSRYSTIMVWPVLVATCRGVLCSCSTDIVRICDFFSNKCKILNIQFETDYTLVQMQATFTLSLTFMSAPWLLRTSTTVRLPPLQAQCMALEPS